ncbi:NAD-dependent epimerase/dehydratase family protein [Rhodotorula paludigena]|uniref:NAD-dependent epimerase/dehydratase family protein n=1 Tax=Rhodotorula paludigena TaxID=86838 RepID=UPI00316B4ACC
MPNVLVTGANGYIGFAVARAFVAEGWTVFGLVRRPETANELEKAGIHPLVGSPTDLAWLDSLDKSIVFSVVSSNTEDLSDLERHYKAVRSMLEQLGTRNQKHGGESTRLMVLVSSGCKDYGRSSLADDPSLAPHTEDSPLNPPPPLKHRTECMSILLDGPPSGAAAYDTAVLRPTNVYGYGSSYWSDFFRAAERALEAPDRTLVFHADERTVLHGTHVDDCGRAYVALAAHSLDRREDVRGKAFNVSNRTYETLEGIGKALAREYALAGVRFDAPAGDVSHADMTTERYSQWVSSERLRSLTGWTEREPGFVEGLSRWRHEYEASKKAQ